LDRGCGRTFNGSNPRYFRRLSCSIIADRACHFIKVKAEALDLGRRHGRSMHRDHLSEVFRKGIDLFLEQEKSGTNGTQLSCINDKGELLHRVGSAFQLVRSGYP
jgi:hypothetical protein